jgi:cyclophilin family peptidyl-prolyl cis-trans isomerase
MTNTFSYCAAKLKGCQVQVPWCAEEDVFGCRAASFLSGTALPGYLERGSNPYPIRLNGSNDIVKLGELFVKRLLFVLLMVGSFGSAQVDDVVYNQSAKRLSYVMDYERILDNATARDCSSAAFESSLLHTTLRTLFLYLPYEASFYPEAETLEVRAVAGDSLVLYATGSLREIRDTNTRFRVFMNGFASSRAGFCFAVDGSVLESWISTLTARGGRVAINTEVLETRLEGLQDIAGLEVPALNEEVVAASQPEPVTQEPVAQEPAPQPEPTPAPQPEPTPQPTPEPQPASEPQSEPAPAPQPTPQTPTVQPMTGFTTVPYVSTERVLNFPAATQVLKPNTDYAAIIETNKGTMTVDLLEQQAPQTVNNFVFLALNQYYDGVSIFRVLDDFIAQSGDPTGTGVGGPGYQFADEIAPGFSHSTAGVLSMANAGPNTNGSQFFFTLAPAQNLDGRYSIFGAVTDGLNVLDSFQTTDPTAPVAIASLDSTLGLLETQGITLDGNDRETLQGYFTRTLGAVPEPALRFAIGNYDAIIGSDGTSTTLSVAFWPKSDVIQHVYIVERAK